MQDLKERQEADARLHLLATDTVAKLVFVGCSITLVCILSFLIVIFEITSGDGPLAIKNDFRVFWAAGQMALAGDLLDVFDTDSLSAIHNVAPEHWMPWLYPPGFLLLVAPFGAVSFAAGYTILLLLSVLCIALAVRPFAAGSRVVWLAFIFAPAYLPMLLQGQNGILWLAGLLSAFAALRSERWILAGAFIGLLTLKPQYGLLIPVALMAAGLWRALLSASVTALIVAAVPTIWTGLEYWNLFIHRLGEYQSRVLASMPELDLAAGPLSLFVHLGLDPGIALLCHYVCTLAVAVCVFLIWRSQLVCFDTKAASLLIASFFASPIVWYNEAAFMALVGLFLLRAGILQPKPLPMLLLCILWLGAGLQVMTIYVGQADRYFPWALLVTPVLALCLALCLRQLAGPRDDTASNA